jgi:hypothetical protein
LFFEGHVGFKKGRGIAPHILNLRKKWKWFAPAVLSSGKNTRGLLNRRLDELHHGLRRFGKEKSCEPSNFSLYAVQN